jgi:hypothetical protein
MAPPGEFSACPSNYEFVDVNGVVLSGIQLRRKSEAQLGSGAYGTTFRMRNKADGLIYAAKVTQNDHDGRVKGFFESNY